jgi:hypothetical protein
MGLDKTKATAKVNKSLRLMMGSNSTSEYTTDAIDRYQEKENKREIRPPKHYFSVSKLFYCPKGAFLDRAGLSEINPCVSVRNMEIGTTIHEYVQNMLSKIYCNYGHVEERLEIEGFPVVGKIDGAIEDQGMLVEIKTTGNSFSFRGGVPDYYVGQSTLYMHMWNILHPRNILDKAWFVVLNRESMTWVNVEPMKLDIGLAKRIELTVKGYDKLWGSGEFPEIEKCKHCGYFYICGANNKMKLQDVLPGGKIREKS